MKMRPKHLAIWQIRFPVPAIVSIMHRVSGAVLFIAIPFILYLLQGSLSSEEAFETYRAVVAYPLVKLILLGVLWGFLHHTCAGVRFLFLDIHKGLEWKTAQTTARAVLVVSLLLTVMIGVLVW